MQILQRFTNAILWEDKTITSLSGADLSYANLSDANLSGAVLSGARLSYASLSGANLSGAILSGARLSGANLSGANLSYANLSDAVLSGAVLSGARLSDANLSGAVLSGAVLPSVLPSFSILPAGDLIVWKKLKEGLCQLKIPSAARRINSTGRKCRAEYVKVLALFPQGTKLAHATYDGTVYRVGKIVRPDKYDPDFRVECSHGIHFFITREEAEAY